IWKTLTKPAEEYQVKASHVEAAKMLHEKGWMLGVGDKIGYVVVVGAGRLYERVKPYMFGSYDEVDIEYYVSKQVVPAAARILGLFGITEDDLLKPRTREKEGKKITDFFSG
ncbi:MAG TPA: DNA polymerase domain-containing protein, partial [Candidatus Bathyarchaeia archaeon]|nr:DNA polymerase domain-containing protein [Candidatus Bathyarchaeia archaeon]